MWTSASPGPEGRVQWQLSAENGAYLGASSVTIDGLTTPEILEAIACCEALAFAMSTRSKWPLIA